MAKNLKNKVVVVTGGAVGIGYEIADTFLKKDAKVTIILDVNEKDGKEAVKTLNAKHGDDKSVFIKCDVTKDIEAVFNKIIDTYKHVDVLVNNAGIIDDTSPKKTMDVNVTALIEWSLKFWQAMRKDKGGNGGTIINMASVYGYRVAPYAPTYTASKFAVMGFTKSLGHEYNYKRTDVRVVAINPGFTETALILNAPKILDDVELQEHFVEYLKEQAWQKADAVGEAAVDVFETAESGTAWLIEGAQPISEIK